MARVPSRPETLREWISLLVGSVVGFLAACLVQFALVAMLSYAPAASAWVPDWGPTLTSALAGLAIPVRKFPGIGVWISLIFMPTAIVLLLFLTLFVGCGLTGDCL